MSSAVASNNNDTWSGVVIHLIIKRMKKNECELCDVMERKKEDDILAEVLHTYIRLHTMEEGKWNR